MALSSISVRVDFRPQLTSRKAAALGVQVPPTVRFASAAVCFAGMYYLVAALRWSA